MTSCPLQDLLCCPPNISQTLHKGLVDSLQNTTGSMYTRHHKHILITEVRHNCLKLSSVRSWELCQKSESLKFIQHKPAQSSVEILMLTHPKFFVVFQRIRTFSHRTNSNLNFGHSSLSHSFHTMSVPATISSLWPREDVVQEVTHSMNVHFHFSVQ